MTKKINVRFFYKAAEMLMLCALLSVCGGTPPPVVAQQTPPPPAPRPAATLAQVTGDELDDAVRAASNYLNGQLPKGNKLVILNVQSEFPALSEYIIDELIANTVNDRVFSVVDRQQLNTIRAELDFQMSGEVDDKTAQSLGRMAGAQVIISGAVSRIGSLYRLRVRALNVQSAQIAGQFNRNIPDGPTVQALVQSRATGYGTMAAGGGAAAAKAAPSAQTAVPAPAPANKVYKVGETGPAGGIIFYDKGAVTNGWRYMEAAPSDFPIRVEWGLGAVRDAIDISGTHTGIGNGKQNTEIIIAKFRISGEEGRAAQVCANLTAGGVTDWFLPSKDELDMMYNILKRNGGFADDWYWSSAQYDRSRVKIQNFGSGELDNAYKDSTRRVRAIRQF